jgi:hypothetical protein
VQAEQPSGLRGHAVRRDELLLLSDRPEEAERVRPEADHPDRGHREERREPGERDAQPLAPCALPEHQERQHEPGGQLHADPGRERDRGRTRVRGRALLAGRAGACGARAQQQRDREREQYQRVVVRAPDREHQQHRVQPDERERERRGAPEPRGGADGEPDREQAAEHRHRFQRPHAARDAEGDHGVAREREQRTVRRVLIGPAHEREDRIRRRVRGDVRVRVEPVQGAHPRERQIAEDVLGDQRRPEQQHQVGEHDGRRQHRERQRARGDEDDEVGGADHEHQRLEAALPELRARACERPGQPARPAAAVAGDVARRRGGGVDADHGERREQREQADRAGGSERRLRDAGARPRRAPPIRRAPAHRGALAGRRRSASRVH